MTGPLYLIWQPEFKQGIPILDEQHRGVLASINSLHYFLQQGEGLAALMPTIKICASYMQFHSKTEQGLLQGVEYPDLANYMKRSEQSFTDFERVCEQAIAHEEPEMVLLFLRKWWQQHMEAHAHITPHLVNFSGQFCRI